MELDISNIRIRNPQLDVDKPPEEKPCYNVIKLKEKEQSYCPTNWGAEVPKQTYLIKENYLSEFGKEEEKLLARDNLGVSKEIELITEIIEEIPDMEPLDFNDIISAMVWNGQ